MKTTNKENNLFVSDFSFQLKLRTAMMKKYKVAETQVISIEAVDKYQGVYSSFPIYTKKEVVDGIEVYTGYVVKGDKKVPLATSKSEQSAVYDTISQLMF